jgi:hypothetical protein
MASVSPQIMDNGQYDTGDNRNSVTTVRMGKLRFEPKRLFISRTAYDLAVTILTFHNIIF